MAKTTTRHDPLEAAKITNDRVASDAATLGAMLPVDPRFPPAPLPAGTSVAAGIVEQIAPVEPVLRDDGPTVEEWIAAGYEQGKYPPEGYAEKPSSGLTYHKVGTPIPEEWIESARRAMLAMRVAAEAIARGEKPPAPKKIVYVVIADGRGNIGGGQIFNFKKGHVLELAGYGERGIDRLIKGGLKLERQER